VWDTHKNKPNLMNEDSEPSERNFRTLGTEIPNPSERGFRTPMNQNSDNQYTNDQYTNNHILVAGSALDKQSFIRDVFGKVDLSKSPENEEVRLTLLTLHIWNDVDQLRPNNKITQQAKLGAWYKPVR